MTIYLKKRYKEYIYLGKNILNYWYTRCIGRVTFHGQVKQV